MIWEKKIPDKIGLWIIRTLISISDESIDLYLYDGDRL